MGTTRSMSETLTSQSQSLRLANWLRGDAAVVVGALVFGGRTINLTVLKRLLPDWAAMELNAGHHFLRTGLGLRSLGPGFSLHSTTLGRREGLTWADESATV